MKFKRLHSDEKNDCSVAIRQTVYAAAMLTEGKLECMEAKMDKLMEILGTIANALPDSVQQAVIDEQCFNWEKAE